MEGEVRRGENTRGAKESLEEGNYKGGKGKGERGLGMARE